MLGNRMSALSLSQFCAQAGRLGSLGAGRPAAMSSTFHAFCSRAANATELAMRLTKAELEEIMSWKRPAPVDVGGVTLEYEAAEKELRVAIDTSGSYVDPESPDAVSVGHLDFAWLVDVDGRKIAYVGDIKRSEYTVEEGTESLQLHAYGLAYATMHRCEGYAVGIWAAVEGRWQWSALYDFEDPATLQIAKRVVAAAQNTGDEYAMGAHCRKCYGRFRCPAWLLPPELAKSKLAPVAQGGMITEDNAADLLLTYQAFKDAAQAVEENLKAWAVRNGGIRDPKSGKVWKPVVCPGRESVSVAGVRATFGEAAEQVIKRGPAYEQFKWVNG